MTRLTLPYIDRIWRASGEVVIDEPLTPDEAFARLDPLFRTPGTSYAVEGDMLTYAKRNPAAQDKLATFTSGALRVEQQPGGTLRLFYHVSSTALLLCFVAPLLFLGFAQAMTQINLWEQAKAAAVAEQDKPAEKPKVKRELHPIDKLLGAPAPEDPAKKKKDKDKPKEKLRTTPAYVLAGLFFVIYLVGRVLEPWLLRRTFRAALTRPASFMRSGESDDAATHGASMMAPPEAARPSAC